MADAIIIHTDGSSLGNPGPGGYGIVLSYRDKQKQLSKGFRRTTNNRMELLAVIDALRSLKTSTIPVVIYTDSKYVCDAVNKNWLQNWQKKHYKNVKNVDLWQLFTLVSKPFNLSLNWVKGHASNKFNNLADSLAVDAAKNNSTNIDSGYENNN